MAKEQKLAQLRVQLKVQQEAELKEVLQQTEKDNLKAQLQQKLYKQYAPEFNDKFVGQQHALFDQLFSKTRPIVEKEIPDRFKGSTSPEIYIPEEIQNIPDLYSEKDAVLEEIDLLRKYIFNTFEEMWGSDTAEEAEGIVRSMRLEFARKISDIEKHIIKAAEDMENKIKAFKEGVQNNTTQQNFDNADLVLAMETQQEETEAPMSGDNHDKDFSSDIA